MKNETSLPPLYFNGFLRRLPTRTTRRRPCAGSARRRKRRTLPLGYLRCTGGSKELSRYDLVGLDRPLLLPSPLWLSLLYLHHRPRLHPLRRPRCVGRDSRFGVLNPPQAVHYHRRLHRRCWYDWNECYLPERDTDETTAIPSRRSLTLLLAEGGWGEGGVK